MSDLISKIKNLKITSKTSEGWDSDYTNFYINGHKLSRQGSLHLKECEVASALGQQMNIKIRALLFEHNPEIFHQIQDMNSELRDLAMDRDSWQSEIDNRLKACQSLLDELSELESKFVKVRVTYYIQRIGR